VVLAIHASSPFRIHSSHCVLLLSSEWARQRVRLSCTFVIGYLRDTFSTIRLPGEGARPAYGGDTGIVATLASVPWFIVGVAGIAWEWVASHVERLAPGARTGYRNLPIDEDAQVLRFEDED
jgi:hypothetical protein